MKTLIKIDTNIDDVAYLIDLLDNGNNNNGQHQQILRSLVSQLEAHKKANN